MNNSHLPNILVLGYKEHGKDFVCELLAKHFGFSFTSSSMFCAEEILFPLMKDKYAYKDAEECFNDRRSSQEKRAYWFEQITQFNIPHRDRLTRAILRTNDIYCGMRNIEEFEASKQHFHCVVWVDRSEHCEPEPESSCTVHASLADIVFDNNGTKKQTEQKVKNLYATIMQQYFNKEIVVPEPQKVEVVAMAAAKPKFDFKLQTKGTSNE